MGSSTSSLSVSTCVCLSFNCSNSFSAINESMESMESTGYLAIDTISRCRGSTYAISSSSSPVGQIDDAYAMVRPEPSMAVEDLRFGQIKLSPDDWRKVNDIAERSDFDIPPVIEVDGKVPIEPLIRSIEEVSAKSDTVWIKLRTDRSSIRVLRKSMKAVERRLKQAKVQTKPTWALKAESFIRSVEKYNQIDYKTSTGESESENEGRRGERPRKCKMGRGSYVDEPESDTETRRTNKKELRYPCHRAHNVWIYCGNFFRNGLLMKKEVPKDFSVTKRSCMDRRIAMSMEINPDPEVFNHVAHEIPWDESDYEPLLDKKLTRDVVKRVLKGMSLGRLYNIDYRQLSYIFKQLVVGGKGLQVKCPLCGQIYSRRLRVMHHMERIHTNFTAFCGSCGLWFSQSETCWQHHCPGR